MALIASVLAVFFVLCVSEIGWRQHWFQNEVGRKFVHITVGSFVAFWPFFMTWTEIRLLSLAFLVGAVVSSYFNVFHAINSVQRPTYGEAFFAVTVGLLTFVTHSKGVYAAALLQMSLADGFAAIFGVRYGRDNKYHLLGHNKSIVGTTAFFITSLSILVGYSIVGTHVSPLIILFGAVTATILENIAALGMDNILVPLFIGFLLTRLHG